MSDLDADKKYNHRRRSSAVCAAMMGLALSIHAAHAATAVGPDGLDDEDVATFLAQLQEAVRAEDAKAVAALVNLPLRVNYAVRGRRGAVNAVRITTSERFVRDYARIFTPNVKQAVLGQAPDKLFRNAQGVMIGDGEVWYAGVCQDRKCTSVHIGIIAVNP